MKTLILTVREVLLRLRELWMGSHRVKFAMVVLFLLAVLSFLSFFSPYDPTIWRVVPRDLSPSWKYLLGTSSLGQDVFWRLTFAVRNSFLLAIIAATISRSLSMTVGMVAGYRGGIVDRVLMFFSDTFLVLPLFLLLVLFETVAREYMNLVSLAALLGVMCWAWDARLIRSQILSLREREFTYTAILSGIPTRKLIFNEYFPFILPLVLDTFINNIIWVIGMEITLAIIGLTPIAIPTLGAMLHFSVVGYEALLLGLWWWLYAPIVASLLLFLALYLFSIGVSEYLDPRARMQRVGAR